MTTLWKWVTVVVAMVAPCMAQELLSAPYRFALSVEADEVSSREIGTHQVDVRMVVMRLGKDPLKISQEMSCSAFDETMIWNSGQEVEVLRSAARAAKDRKPFKEENGGSVFESLKKGNRWVVTMTRGERVATFLPSESDRLDRALSEARAAERWYRALLAGGPIPQETPEAHPPFSHGMDFRGNIGTVAGENLKFGAILTINERGDSVIWNSLGTGGHSISAPWVSDVPDFVAAAITAVRRGESYSHEGKKFHVMSDGKITRADLIFFEDGMRGSFNERNLAEMDQLQADADARSTWFKQNERLFFKPIKKVP